MDLKRNFSYRLPAAIVCDLFGIPEEHRADILRGGEVTTDSSITAEEAEANIRMWTGQFANLIAAKRRSPEDDMTTDLINAVKEDGAKLTDSELIGTLFVVLGAGSETVMNLLTHAVHKLLIHPEQRAMLDDGRATWDDVIEETLRAESPINMLPLRFAVEDIEVDGVTIPKATPSSWATPHRAATPRCTGTPPTSGTSPAPTRATSASATARTTASAPRWPGWKRRSRCPRCSSGSRTSARGPDGKLEPQGTFIMNGWKTLPVHLTAPAAAGRR